MASRIQRNLWHVSTGLSYTHVFSKWKPCGLKASSRTCSWHFKQEQIHFMTPTCFILGQPVGQGQLLRDGFLTLHFQEHRAAVAEWMIMGDNMFFAHDLGVIWSQSLPPIMAHLFLLNHYWLLMLLVRLVSIPIMIDGSEPFWKVTINNKLPVSIIKGSFEGKLRVTDQ